ncbi:MAG: DUF4432 family protein [Acidobacteriaceae bacterium]
MRWKNRHAYHLSNDKVELTVLPGGGHLVDFRLKGSPVNALWEAPWDTIEPQTFSAEDAAIYGSGPVGKFLSGYTGHALVLGYFGMPSDSQVEQGLPLHGEAASAEWKVCDSRAGETSAILTLEVELRGTMFHCRREITLRSGDSAAFIEETVTNHSGKEVEFQWVQHTAFGEPLFAAGEASLWVPGKRAITWPLGYEGHEILLNDAEFTWPNAPTVDGTKVDLSQPFPREGTGFVASLLLDSGHSRVCAAVHNQRLSLVAGYCFERERFPWIAFWEENRARTYLPWNGVTRVRGVEFGTSPMPMGLEHARKMGSFFGTPVVAKLLPKAQTSTSYEIFITRVPSGWQQISEAVRANDGVAVRNDAGHEIVVRSSRA